MTLVFGNCPLISSANPEKSSLKLSVHAKWYRQGFVLRSEIIASYRIHMLPRVLEECQFDHKYWLAIFSPANSCTIAFPTG